MVHPKQRLLIGLSVASDIAILDLLTKYYLFSPETNFSWFGGLVQHVTHRNYGLIANLPLPQPFIILLTGSLLVLFVRWWIKRAAEAPFLAHIGAGLVLGGAIGNVVDRIVYGYVRDWILLVHQSAINIADIAIVAGILLLMTFGRTYLNPTVSETQGKNPPA